MAKKNSTLKEYNRQMFKDYKKSLKHAIFDETLTLYILRPIAFVIVKLLYRTSVTPNQVSYTAILFGIISALFFSTGTLTGFLVGGILYFFILVLDCVDGMIARLKKNGTPVGRIIDGFADYTIGIFVYIGMGIGLDKGIVPIEFPISHWWLLVIASLSHIVHAMLVDYYRGEFMAHGLGRDTSTWEANQKFNNELAEIKDEKGRFFDKFLIALYLGYSRLQLFKLKKKEVFKKDQYFQKNQLLIKLWFWIGPTAHIFVLIFAAIVFRPGIYFIYTIWVANVYMIILWIIQVNVNKKIIVNN
jgi:phosphatidylglycerophosphate synthase